MADLVERVSTAPRSPYGGAGFRQIAPRYEPLSGEGARMLGGRFNPPDSFAVLYVCSTAGCAAAEFMRSGRAQPIGPSGLLPRSLYRYEIQLSGVLDLTDPATLDHLEVSRSAMIDDDLTLTRQIGEIAHQSSYQAIRNASATGVDDVIAVLIENLRSGVLLPTLEATWATMDDVPLL